MSQSKAIPPVRLGSVVIPIRILPDGRFRFQFRRSGRWHQCTSADLSLVKRRALAEARKLINGGVDLNALEPWQREACMEVVNLGLTAKRVVELSKRLATPLLSDMVKEFLATKKMRQGRSTRHYDGLVNDLNRLSSHFDGRHIGDITAAELEKFWGAMDIGERRFNNLREKAVCLWRWARMRGNLPDGITQPERVEKIRIGDRTIQILTPAELGILLREVRPIYRSWLILSAWAGIRQQEMFPPSRSSKRPFMWEDVDLERKLITVRPETSKTSKRRLIPMADRLVKELSAIADTSGRVGPVNPPSSKETLRLSEFLGRKWPTNCLRHSFGSYRAAIVQNLGQVSLEMGNSIAVCQAHYHLAVTREEAERWFG